jgi:hypothetical protein
MLTPSTPIPTPLSPDTTNTAKAASVEASARSAVRNELRAGTANEARLADAAATAAAARRAATEVPDPMASLSTVAVAGAMNSLPAALNMMRNIVMASASGRLSDADRQTLQTEYAQLTAKVVGSVGSAGAGEPSQQSTAHDHRREDDAGDTRREDSDDPRTTLTQTVEVAKETGPVSARQSMTHPTTPETFGRIESDAATQHTFVAQAAQITQFVQVAQAEHIAPVVAVA